METGAIDWSSDGIVARREKHYAASQRAFKSYPTALIFSCSQGQ
jgi:hypothetical protein